MALPFKPLASLAPQFTIARCTPADVPQLWDVYSAACLGTRFCYFWPASLEAMARWTDLRFRQRFQDPTDQEFKVVDNENGGRIAGFARWMVPEAMDQTMGKGFRTYSEAESGLPEGIDIPEMAEGGAGACLEEFLRACQGFGRQGRGLSTALLQPMLDLADQLGVTAYLEALENAVPVYEKLGFKKVDELIYDESKTGLEGVRRIDIMLREPRATS
ncbi:GNAT family acetyltransferase [Apiospora arundinis]